MDVYDISNITDIKEDVVKKWTIRQRTKASTCRALYKILECEMSVLSAKLPFLQGSQIKCIALNWIGIPTIMGHIPNTDTIGYLVPAEKKKRVMTMIHLLFSKREASKKEEKLMNELCEMILKTCTSVISHKNSTSCNRDETLGAETIESASSNSNMMLTPINDRPEEHNTEKTVSEKLDRKRRLFWGPGCLLSEKRRKKRLNNSNSVLSEDSLQPLSDDVVEGSTTDSENIIAGTPAVSKSKNTSPKNVPYVKQPSEAEEPCNDSNVTRQNLVSDPSENSAAKGGSNERNAVEDSSMPVIADVDGANKIVLDGFCDVQLQNKTSTSNETGTTETEKEEVALVQHKKIKNTGILTDTSMVAISSENQILQNEQIDLLKEPQEIMSATELCRAAKAKKNVKVSATVLVLVEKGSEVDTTKSSPTPSSQQLAHLSPIQYLSLEPYSSEEESQDKTACQGEEIAIEKQNCADLLVDLFSPVTSDTNQRTLVPAEASGDQTILSFDKEEGAQVSK